MWVGLLLTAVAAMAPLIDIALTDSVAQHVREAYPGWGRGTVSTERNAIVGWLVITGLMGVAGWLLAIRGASGGSHRTRRLAVTMLLLGAALALLNLTAAGEQYDVIVPTTFGALTATPVAEGVVAVGQLWREQGAPAQT